MSALAGLAAIAPLWVDAGIASPERAQRVIALGAAARSSGSRRSRRSMRCRRSAQPIGGERVAFSLDLRGGDSDHQPPA